MDQDRNRAVSLVELRMDKRRCSDPCPAGQGFFFYAAFISANRDPERFQHLHEIYIGSFWLESCVITNLSAPVADWSLFEIIDKSYGMRYPGIDRMSQK